MKLYLTPHACSMAVDIVARDADIPLELEWVDVRNKKLKDGSDYFRINPKGQVPALETDNGEFVTEGGVIIQYLLDSSKGHNLLSPELSLDRYRVLEWISFISSEVHKSFTPLFRPTTPDEYREITIENLRKRFTWLDSVLADQPFLCGEAFTAADAYAYTILMWHEIHKLDLSDFPNIQAFLERVGERPSVQAAIAAEKAELAAQAEA